MRVFSRLKKYIFERKQHGEDDDDVNDDVNDEALSSLVFGRALTDSLSLSREEEEEEEEEAFIKWFCLCEGLSFRSRKKEGLVFFFKNPKLFWVIP